MRGYVSEKPPVGESSLRESTGQFLRFAVVGVLAFLVDASVLQAALALGLDPYSGRVASYLCAATAALIWWGWKISPLAGCQRCASVPACWANRVLACGHLKSSCCSTVRMRAKVFFRQCPIHPGRTWAIWWRNGWRATAH